MTRRIQAVLRLDSRILESSTVSILCLGRDTPTTDGKSFSQMVFLDALILVFGGAFINDMVFVYDRDMIQLDRDLVLNFGFYLIQLAKTAFFKMLKQEMQLKTPISVSTKQNCSSSFVKN